MANNKPQSSQPSRHQGMHARIMMQKPKNMKETLKKLIKYFGYKKYLIFTMILLVFIASFVSVIAPIMQASAIEAITISNGELSQYKFFQDIIGNLINKEYMYINGAFNGKDFFFPFIIILGLLYLLSAILNYFTQRIGAKISQTFVFKMRSDLFKRIVYLPVKFIDNNSHGDIMSRMTNDVENVSNALSQALSSLISGFLTIIGTLFIMFYYNWFLGIITFVSVLSTILISQLLTKKMGFYFRKRSVLLGELNGHAEEMITGYKTIKAYSKEKDSEEVFENISKDYTKVSIMGDIWGGSMGPMMNLISNLTYLIVAISGALIMVNKPFNIILSVGTISLFLTSVHQLTRPINQIANLVGQVITALAGAERVFEVIEENSEVDDGNIVLTKENVVGNIEFKNINFNYIPEEEVLRGFSLSIKPGEKIALVGATGSGKTTVVNLLMRFYELDEGEILIDGINIKDIKKEYLRKAIAIVLQDTVLFKDTIANNIKYGNDSATFDEIKNAAILSNANYFIRKLSNKYDTILSESGSNISQGQRQLISIARAILADPKILILDEATSSVDTRTEKNIQDAMLNLMKNRTSIIIAHRLSTIRDANKIVVMDKGSIVEVGNHEELLSKKGKYYDLYMTQFAGKEI
ncbi:MAG: ABC transporter ATP-binding protein [Bacilli bacterium]